MNLQKLPLIAIGTLLGMILTVGIIKISPYWPDPMEYQIRLEMDSAYIYNKNGFVGSCKHGSDGIDSVLLNDNL